MGKPKKSRPSHQRRLGVQQTGLTALSQAEVWDDSALIRSWDDAVQEYEYYHSIHAKGEDIEEVLRKAEAEEDGNGDVTFSASEWQSANENSSHGPAAATAAVRSGENDDELEDGEVSDDRGDVEQQNGVKLHTLQAETYTHAPNQHHPHVSQPQQAMIQPPSGAQLPPTRATGTAPSEDQTLENLKMSYYWAGYYSGLYDGQRQSRSRDSKPGSNLP